MVHNGNYMIKPTIIFCFCNQGYFTRTCL